MQRFRTKPAKTAYVVALHDKAKGQFIVQDTDAAGKLLGEVYTISEPEFLATYDPLVRTPRAAAAPVVPRDNGLVNAARESVK